MNSRPGLSHCLVLIATFCSSAHTHEGHTGPLEEIVVYGRATEQIGEARAASEGLVGYADITLPPLLRVGELVEAIPGMVATQHSGTGKANQYFLRGFNLDHGTDFAGFAGDVPINMRTHGHGQGYLDLNFLMPELVATTAYRKGPYGGAGDFSSAGSVSFQYVDRLDEALLELSGGSFGYARALAAGSLDTETGTTLLAIEGSRYDGPWRLGEDLEAYKFYAAHTWNIGGLKATASLHGYDSSWNATDQIPQRAVSAGLIDELGFIDPDLGGETARFAGTFSLESDAWRATAYVVDYRFELYSNFTYLLEDPLAGDQFEQRDTRQIYGLRINGAQEVTWAERPVNIRWGTDLRYDDIDEVGLYATRLRQRQSTIREDAVEEQSAGAYVDMDIRVTDRLRALVGVRADHYRWDVSAFRPLNSGSGNDTLVSPNAGLAYRVNDASELYLNWGRGFHSNDVRGATIRVDPTSGESAERVDALVQSEGGEAGFRVELGERFNASLVAFWLELDSELVFVGDGGSTEALGATRRLGGEASVFWRLAPWLAMNAAYTFTDARFKENEGAGREVPGAVESVFTLGLNATWSNGLSVSTRLRYLSDAPLVEDGSVSSEASFLMNAGVAYRWRNIEMRLDALNLLDSNDHDISYFYASRLAGEAQGGVEDIHYHPLEPRSLRASFRYRF